MKKVEYEISHLCLLLFYKDDIKRHAYDNHQTTIKCFSNIINQFRSKSDNPTAKPGISYCNNK